MGGYCANWELRWPLIVDSDQKWLQHKGIVDVWIKYGILKTRLHLYNFYCLTSFGLSNSFCRCSVDDDSMDVERLLLVKCYCSTKICDSPLVDLDQRSWKKLNDFSYIIAKCRCESPLYFNILAQHTHSFSPFLSDMGLCQRMIYIAWMWMWLVMWLCCSTSIVWPRLMKSNDKLWMIR